MTITEMVLEEPRLKVGREMEYSIGGKMKCVGIVQGVRMSDKTIYNIKTGVQKYAFEFQVKPNDGGRAIWTKAFPSKFVIDDTPTPPSTNNDSERKG